MSAADFGPAARPAPARTPARARPRIDPQIQARMRELAFKTLDVADGILDRLKTEQARPEPAALPLAAARRQTVNLLGVPLLCERRRCRRTKLCAGEPSHCLSACLHVLPHDVIARVLSAKAIRQRVRRK